ncbi:MAG: glutaminyl-peptide cyclotransferase, partial [Bacteroidales bacterium]|nr:glutaminyl-peptide cyclotransferase [Bacteroidales bacterium]
MRHLYIYILFFAAFLISCGGGSDNNSTITNNHSVSNNQPTSKSHFTLSVESGNNDNLGVCGDVFRLKVLCDTALTPDSIRFLVDGKQVYTLLQDSVYQLDTKNFRVGNVRLSAEVMYNGKTEYLSGSLRLKSDITPQRVKYKVIKRFPHDRGAYTQGLVFDEGVMYESTGLNRKSSLRKVKFETGDIIQSVALNDTYFGEGLAIDGNNLFQITWKNHKGFVYDKNTFATLHEFDINTEGWGLVLYND